MSPPAQDVHLYRYEYPPGHAIYVGQGAKRDPAHRSGKSSFGRRFKRDFPGVELPQPIRWTEPAANFQERNDRETAAIDFYHTWHREGGYNIGRPGSSDYENMAVTAGKVGGRATNDTTNGRKGNGGRITGPINGKIMGKKWGPINGKMTGPITGPINFCLRWNIRRGKPCTCSNHMPTELA